GAGVHRVARERPDVALGQHAERMPAHADQKHGVNALKLKLGKLWEKEAKQFGSDKYRYFMVFENNKLEGANSVEEVIEILRAL
ncbi:MAG: hypothetical protein AAF806_31370, partial [Bacteroidota bacterium]